MTGLVGAVARRPDLDVAPLARALAVATKRRRGAEAKAIHEERGLALWHVAWRPPSNPPRRGRLSDGTSLVVVGNPDTRDVPPERLFEACGFGAAREGDVTSPFPIPDRRWLAAFHRPGEARLRLLGDRLGTAWLFLAETDDAVLFGPDFGALLSTLPAAPPIDRETALVTLALAYAPDDRTCREGVTILPPATLVEVGSDGIRPLRREAPRYGDRHAGLGAREKERRLEALLDDAARVWLPERDDRLLLSLSGGNDSKYGVLLLERQRRKAHAVTFGAPRSGDARAARGIARRLGWRATSYYDRDRTDWNAWRDSVAIAGTTGGYQWAGWAGAWLGLLESLGEQVMLGFMGDAISGRHLVASAGPSGNWLDHWLAWSLDEGWADAPVLRPESARTMREASRARFEAMLRGVAIAYPHQAALHLDWYARQRRHTASQANLLDRHAEPLLYFYTEGMLDFWANLPFEDLHRQSLYLRFARDRAPDLWPAPRRAGLVERAWGTARNAAAALVPPLRRALLPTEIDIGRMIAQNRDRLADLAREEGEFVALAADPERVIRSIRGYPTSTEMTSFQIMRLANWLLVLRQGTARGERASTT